jgi:hypothetical protein
VDCGSTQPDGRRPVAGRGRIMLKKLLKTVCCVLILQISNYASAADAETEAPKEMSGMSVLGNSEAPKSLVIVPWKTSEIGDGIGVANMLDGRAAPVDRDVFSRQIEFYELRSAAPPRRLEQPGSEIDALAQQ